MTGDGRIDQIAARPSKARRCPILIQRWKRLYLTTSETRVVATLRVSLIAPAPAVHHDTKKVPEQPCSANLTNPAAGGAGTKRVILIHRLAGKRRKISESIGS
jgi:hypothetical protein